MRTNNAIDPSLKKKINQNDEKVKYLYDIEFKISKSKKGTTITTPGVRPRNLPKNKNTKSQEDSYSEIILKGDNNNEQNHSNDEFDRKISKKISKDAEPSAFMSRMKKRMKFKNDKEEKKNNTVFYNTFSNVYKNMEKKKKKKTFNKAQVDEFVNRLYHNDYKHRKPLFKEDEVKENKNDNENNVDPEEFIERFEEDLKKRNENLENKKKEIENDEKQKFTYKPKMCKGSIKYNEGNKDNFFERQKNFEEKKNKKEEKIKEILKKKEEDEFKKDNILLKKKEEKKEDSKKNKENVNKTIKNLYEWDSQRKKKLEDKKKQNTEKIEKDYDYVPKINERSVALAENNRFRQKEPNVFERLAKTDEMLKDKRQILIDMYTPTFKPQSYVPRNMNLEKLKKKNYMSQRDNQNEEEEEEEDEDEKKKRKKRKKHRKKNENSDEENEDDDEDEDEEGEEEEDDEEEEEEKEEKEVDEFDFKQDTMKYADNEVQDALRNTLFNKKNKK